MKMNEAAQNDLIEEVAHIFKTYPFEGKRIFIVDEETEEVHEIEKSELDEEISGTTMYHRCNIVCFTLAI